MFRERVFPCSSKDETSHALEAFIGPAPKFLIGAQASTLPRSGKHVVISRFPTQWLQRELAGAGYSYMYDFCVLLRRGEPRWLLPLADSGIMLSGLQIYKPFALRGRLLKTLLAGTIVLGWRGWNRPKVLLASLAPLPLQVMVTEVTGEERPAFALWLGNRESFRTLTVQVMRPNGEVLGYIKLPLTGAAAERVRHEAKLLTRLWDKFPCLRPHIPQVLHSSQWNGGFMLFQSSGPRARGPSAFGRLHTRFLQQLWKAEPVRTAGHRLVEEVAAGWQRVQPQLATEWRDLGEASLQEASRRLEGATVSCGVMHGDFAPWNTRQENGRLFVFDWESAKEQTPKLWDVFHFDEKVTSLLDKKPVRYAEFGLTCPADDASFLLYSLRAVCKALEDGGSLLEPKLNYHKEQILRGLQGSPKKWSGYHRGAKTVGSGINEHFKEGVL